MLRRFVCCCRYGRERASWNSASLCLARWDRRGIAAYDNDNYRTCDLEEVEKFANQCSQRRQTKRELLSSREWYATPAAMAMTPVAPAHQGRRCGAGAARLITAPITRATNPDKMEYMIKTSANRWGRGCGRSSARTCNAAPTGARS